MFILNLEDFSLIEPGVRVGILADKELSDIAKVVEVFPATPASIAGVILATEEFGSQFPVRFGLCIPGQGYVPRWKYFHRANEHSEYKTEETDPYYDLDFIV